MWAESLAHTSCSLNIGFFPFFPFASHPPKLRPRSEQCPGSPHASAVGDQVTSASHPSKQQLLKPWRSAGPEGLPGPTLSSPERPRNNPSLVWVTQQGRVRARTGTRPGHLTPSPSVPRASPSPFLPKLACSGIPPLVPGSQPHAVRITQEAAALETESKPTVPTTQPFGCHFWSLHPSRSQVGEGIRTL